MIIKILNKLITVAFSLWIISEHGFNWTTSSLDYLINNENIKLIIEIKK
jgi:hypothetical protein